VAIGDWRVGLILRDNIGQALAARGVQSPRQKWMAR